MEVYGEWVELTEALKDWLAAAFESIISALAAMAEHDNRADADESLDM